LLGKGEGQAFGSTMWLTNENGYQKKEGREERKGRSFASLVHCFYESRGGGRGGKGTCDDFKKDEEKDYNIQITIAGTYDACATHIVQKKEKGQKGGALKEGKKEK